mgnify:CR=1 FL=1
MLTPKQIEDFFSIFELDEEKTPETYTFTNDYLDTQLSIFYDKYVQFTDMNGIESTQVSLDLMNEGLLSKVADLMFGYIDFSIHKDGTAPLSLFELEKDTRTGLADDGQPIFALSGNAIDGDYDRMRLKYKNAERMLEDHGLHTGNPFNIETFTRTSSTGIRASNIALSFIIAAGVVVVDENEWERSVYTKLGLESGTVDYWIDMLGSDLRVN